MIREMLKQVIKSKMKKNRPGKRVYSRLEGVLYPLLMLSLLLGMSHVREELDKRLLFAELTAERAVETMRERLALPPEVYRELSAEAHFRAFSVARLSSMSAIERVQKQLTGALERGETMSEWVKKLGEDEIIRKAGFGEESPYYLETVFRTNANNAYNGGKWREIQEKKERIFALEYIGIDDDRQTELCRKLNGTILPPDHRFWTRYFPPNHYNERSTTRTISRAEARALGIELSKEIPRAPLPAEFRSHPANWWQLSQKMVEKLAALGEAAATMEEFKKLSADLPVLQKYISKLTKLFRSRA